MCGLCVNLAVDGSVEVRERTVESTILATSDPALSLWFWSVLVDSGLMRLRGRDMEMCESICELWVAKNGRE